MRCGFFSCFFFLKPPTKYLARKKRPGFCGVKGNTRLGLGLEPRTRRFSFVRLLHFSNEGLFGRTPGPGPMGPGPMGSHGPRAPGDPWALKGECRSGPALSDINGRIFVDLCVFFECCSELRDHSLIRVFVHSNGGWSFSLHGSSLRHNCMFLRMIILLVIRRTPCVLVIQLGRF